MSRKTSRRSSPLFRGIAVVGAMLIAAGAISPALGKLDGKEKKQAKKIAIKQIKRLVPGMITNVGDQNYVQKDNVVPFAETLSFGQTKTLATNGPLTLELRCTRSGGTDEIALWVKSSAANWWTTNASTEYNAPGEARLYYHSRPQATEDVYYGSSDEQSALAQSGTQVFYAGHDDYKWAFGLNALGHNCTAAGLAVLA